MVGEDHDPLPAHAVEVIDAVHDRIVLQDATGEGTVDVARERITRVVAPVAPGAGQPLPEAIDRGGPRVVYRSRQRRPDFS